MAKVKIHGLGVVILGILAPAALADPTPPVDAFINLGAGPYPEESTITTGNSQPWYDSTQIAGFFGGQPTAAQQSSFDTTVLQRVEQTFSQSGVPITLTDHPAVAADHTLSLVSNTASSSTNSAIGMTDLGKNGFSFIDSIAPSAQSLDQLEWIVAHNLSHELMLAFGVGENYDRTGNYIDAPMASWAMITSPSAIFSAAAAQALLNQNLGGQAGIVAEQLGTTQTVPEPATVAVWLLAAASFVGARGRSRRFGA
jgi:hypothetical protein